jgi:carbonic anhydrase
VSIVDEIVAANQVYAETFDAANIPMPPRRQLAILTCMDARIYPNKIFGLREGDAHIIRNAGGRARDALRSLAMSQELQGTREIIVLHHNDCGLLGISNAEIRSKLVQSLGPDAMQPAGQIDFLPWPDVEQALRNEMYDIRTSPLIRPNTPITGFVYDEQTGLVRRVEGIDDRA